MSKFDRCIFISIAIGIWALAMTQVFKPEILQASFVGNNSDLLFTTVEGKCPGYTTKSINISGDGTTELCFYLLTASYDDLLKHPEYFR